MSKLTVRQAMVLLSRVVSCIQKYRSTLMESVDGDGRLASILYPEIFNASRTSPLAVALNLQDRGEKITPMNIFNLLYLCERDDGLNMQILMMNLELGSDEIPKSGEFIKNHASGWA